MTHISKKKRLHFFTLHSQSEVVFLCECNGRRYQHKNNDICPVWIITSCHIKNLNQCKRDNKATDINKDCKYAVYK